MAKKIGAIVIGCTKIALSILFPPIIVAHEVLKGVAYMRDPELIKSEAEHQLAIHYALFPNKF